MAFLSSQKCYGKKKNKWAVLPSILLINLFSSHKKQGADCFRGWKLILPAVLSEVLLPTLLRFNSIEDWLSFRLVLLADLFDFLLHHGIKG